MAKVELTIEAIDKASNVLGNIFDALKNGASALDVLSIAAQAGSDFVRESVQAFADYAEQVQDFSRITGASAEETSRLIQVADDARISFDTLKVAARMAAKDGVALTIDEIKKLSEEYLKLAPGAERSAFLIEKFGRNGLEMGKLLSLGSTGVDKLNAGIGENLILTERDIAAQKEYLKSLDNLNDSYEGLKVEIGGEVVPVINQIFQGMLNTAQAQDDYNRRLQEAIQLYGDHGDRANNMRVALMAEQEALYAARDAVNAHADALDGVIVATEEAGAAVYNLDVNYKEQLGLIESMQSAQNTFNEQYKAIASDQNLTDDQRKAKFAELAAEHDMASKKIILGLLEQQMAQDGLSQEEMNFLLLKGQAWGIYSDTVVTEAQKAYREAQLITEAINTIPTQRTFTMRVMLEGGQNLGGIGGASFGSSGFSLPGRASGGPVSGGRPYIVGEQGPELFVPNSSGNIVPNGSGSVININISTPALIGDGVAARDALLPILRDGVRQLQAEGALPQ